MFWEKYGSEEYAGIVGLDYTLDGQVVGDLLPDQKSVNLIDLLVGKYHINNGDRTNVVRTELYKQVAPMRGFPGEKNFNPHYMHLQISQNYDFLVMNESLRLVDYQAGGMSDSVIRQYKDSPNSFAETRKLYLSFPNTSLLFKIRQTIHLVSSCIIAGKPGSAFEKSPYKLLTTIFYPFGILLASYINIKTKD